MESSNGKSGENTKRMEKTAVVIGGGLVGALCVCILAERGYHVMMFEKREDIRKSKTAKGRSINLALSHRGRQALRLVGLEDKVLRHGIPMGGRCLHNEAGETTSVPYDPVTKRCIYSVGRNFLNRTLLDAAEKYPNIKLYFKHKLVNADFEKRTIKVLNLESKESLETSSELIIGADGAFSNLRSFMQKTALFDFSQTYIEHGYMELSVPPENGDKLRPNHLHIWPRGEFMMIALPNQDGSWTVTLFMPFKKFEILDSGEKALNFFKSTFSDALPLIGESNLVNDFISNQPSPLVSIKCGKYEMNETFLIIGDAAHAMVPFYGQGMNAGFEDCYLLNHILNDTHDNIPKTIKTFTEKRKSDAHAICDLAMYNYVEMRDLVRKPSFKLRKTVDKILGSFMPDLWIPLYNSVSFSHMGYSQCVENKSWQDKVLFSMTCLTAVFCIIVTIVLMKVINI